MASESQKKPNGVCDTMEIETMCYDVLYQVTLQDLKDIAPHLFQPPTGYIHHYITTLVS